MILSPRPAARARRPSSPLRAIAVLGAAVTAPIVLGAAAPTDDGATSPDRLRRVWTVPGCHCLLGAERVRPSAPWGAPHKVFDVRGAVGRIVFSPDGRRIAFENPRGDLTTPNPKGDPSLRGFETQRAYAWSFIATFDFKARRLDYVDPSFFEDRDPSWSASGAAITFTRRIEGQADARLTRPVPGHDPAARGSERSDALAALLSAPVVFQASASGDGRTFVYAARQGPLREIDLKAQGRPARRLAVYAGDDGQELSEAALSPNGDVLAYVRGGPSNRLGDSPNPRSLPVKPEREVWILGTGEGQTPVKIGPGRSPQFTRDGDHLLWTVRGGVEIAPMIRHGRRIGVGPVSRLLSGEVSEVRLSPDGERLLFAAGDSVGVYDLKTDQTWMIERPKDAVDVSAIWSPDGRRIAFIRLTGPQPKLIRDGLLGNGGPYESKVPWSILTADLGERSVARIWQAAPGRGSAYFPMDQDPTGAGRAEPQIFWAAGDKIVFEWEGDGWRHLYALASTGGAPTLLTPGAGEVETATLSLDRRHVLAASNIGDLGRRHILAIDVATGAVDRLTGGEASQWAPTALADGALAVVSAGWADPPGLTVLSPRGDAAATGLPAVRKGFARRLFVRPELIDVQSSDGAHAFGQLFRPREPSGCGVVFAHGGIQRQMLPGFHYMEGYSNLYEVNQYLASRGCAVLSIEYRSSIMRGFDFRNAPAWGNAGASEMNDVLGAANALKADASLKVQNVGIWGLSWGGYITAQALANHSDVFAAGFDVAGVHAFFGDRERFGPLAAVATWRSPLFLAQGDDDRNVDFYQGVRLARALAARGDVTTVFRVVPDETHDVNLTLDHLIDVYGTGADFLIDQLTPSRDRAAGRPRPRS